MSLKGSEETLFVAGGFAVVYKVRSPRGQLHALKRMAVNNDQDLHLAKQEIAITVSISGQPSQLSYGE